MDRSGAKSLRMSLEKALKVVEEEFGMEIRVKSISYGEDNFHCKIEGLEVGAESAEAKCYRRMATSDIPPLGSKILLQGTEFTVLGWKRRAPKWPIIIEDNTGGRFKITRGQLMNSTVLT